MLAAAAAVVCGGADDGVGVDDGRRRRRPGAGPAGTLPRTAVRNLSSSFGT